jgi:hypothetical protein
MGFASPSYRHLHTRVHSHNTRGYCFGYWLPHQQSCSIHVVPPHLDGFLREQAVSLLHLTTGKRFTAFLRCPLHTPCFHTPYADHSRSPQCCSHPSKNSLASSRTVSPRPLPSWCLSSLPPHNCPKRAAVALAMPAPRSSAPITRQPKPPHSGC